MGDLVSIIMPSYNCGKYIQESLESVFSQTYQNWELIIVDDCSTDNTTEIVNNLIPVDERIQFYQNASNSGAAISRNKALRQAKGRWIAFLDSDDIWEPEKLEKQVRFMEQNGYAFSYTCYQEIDENSNLTGVIIRGPKRITKKGMYCFCWPGCLTVIYDREIVGDICINDIKKNNDYAMWLKVCKKAECYFLDECLAKYRRGRVGSVSSHSVVKMIKWHYKLFREAEGLNVFYSLTLTGVNLICGLYKKMKYVEK